MTANQVQELMLSNIDKEYKIFNERIVAPECPTLGVRTPVMRNAAKSVVNIGDVEYFLKHYPWHYFEDIMVRGMVIGYYRWFNFEQQALYIDQWLDYACSWAHIDCVTSSLTISKLDRVKFWDFATSYLTSDKEYKVRFGVIALMDFFIDDKHIKKILKIYTNIRSDHYYVQTGVAWALSVCFIKFRDKTLDVLQSGKVDAIIQNLTIRKITESTRVSGADKALVRTLKRSQVDVIK